MIRLGYACLTLGMPDPSMRAAQLGRYDRGLVDLGPIYEYNVEYARRSVEFAAEHGLLVYRLSSDIFPLLDYAPRARALAPPLDRLRRALRTTGVHASNHPSQFVVLSSPNEGVVRRSLRVLDDAGWVMSGAGATGSITLHGGGVYDDRAAAGARLANNLTRMTPASRRRLALENDEKCWTVGDLLEATSGRVPIVFDRLHWEVNPRSDSYEAELGAALGSWPARRIPELHYSEQAQGKARGTHADFVSGRPLLEFLGEVAEAARGREVAVVVEAKKKDLAIARAIGELGGRAYQRLLGLVPDLGRAPRGWLAEAERLAAAAA